MGSRFELDGVLPPFTPMGSCGGAGALGDQIGCTRLAPAQNVAARLSVKLILRWSVVGNVTWSVPQHPSDSAIDRATSAGVGMVIISLRTSRARSAYDVSERTSRSS